MATKTITIPDKQVDWDGSTMSLGAALVEAICLNANYQDEIEQVDPPAMIPNPQSKPEFADLQIEYWLRKQLSSGRVKLVDQQRAQAVSDSITDSDGITVS